MVAVGWVGRPVGIGVMRRNDFDNTAVLRNSMQLAYKRHYIRNVLYHVTANDLIKLVVRKWIRHDAEIVNNICMGTWI